jgi:signal transduction histidine kinase
MSIRDVGRNTANQSGLEKKIDTGASRLVFDILQATQYSYPIPSTVRELATNAWDSQREKEVAIEILTGKKREEDYYIRRDDEQYSASNFDSSYYDLDHFSEDSLVTLRYTQRNGSGFCDTFEVIDRGVGISLKRLEGLLSLGFSTKRNTSEGFGAFGLTN